MSASSPLVALARPDKWYLGGGNRLVWTPLFPAWLAHLGFWDEAQYYNLPLQPVFALTLLDEAGREIACRFVDRQWQPDRMVQRYTTDAGLEVTEKKALLPNDTLVSQLTLTNTRNAPRTLHLIQWTMQAMENEETGSYVRDAGCDGKILSYTKDLLHRDGQRYAVACAMGWSHPATSFGIQRSQGRVLPPRWAYTPFAEQFDGQQLANQTHTDGLLDGVLYLATHTALTLAAGASQTVHAAFAAAPDATDAATALRETLALPNPVHQSTQNWSAYFARVPSFSCSNPHLEAYFRYRWYGLRLFSIQGDAQHYRYPAVCEGPGYFRAPISYSAQCHLLETRWMDTPHLAQGSLLNFIDTQQPDGRFVGYLHPRSLPLDFFYHANWGLIWKLHQCHPDEAFLRRAYEGLCKYVGYFDATRDAEGSGLYDIQNHYETGQEYMHRYVAVEAHADRDNWGQVFRLKGVDVSVYLYELKRTLARIARHVDNPAAAKRWDASAQKTGAAILEKMWDPEADMFFDVNPHTGQRTGVKAAVCFYPYFTDLVDATHLAGLRRNLLNPATFWTPYPVPSSSLDDAYFNADAQWKGQRMNCPWNGRVWPMTNSHIAEALAHTALRFQDAALRTTTAAFITRFVEMMFFEGDAKRPNCFEHYNPFNGKASVYRGVDDYQHSWVVDLIIQYLCGVRPADTHLVIDPFPFEIDTFCLKGVVIRGQQITVERRGQRFSVWRNGEAVADETIGNSVLLEFI